MEHLKYKDIIKALEPFAEQKVCACMAEGWVQFFTEDGMRTIIPLKEADDNMAYVVKGYKTLSEIEKDTTYNIRY